MKRGLNSSSSAARRKAQRALSQSSAKKSRNSSSNNKTPESDYQKQRANDPDQFYGKKKRARVVNSYLSNSHLSQEQAENLMQLMDSDDSFM